MRTCMMRDGRVTSECVYDEGEKGQVRKCMMRDGRVISECVYDEGWKGHK